jgi:polysaccharide export outer membrane protein
MRKYLLIVLPAIYIAMVFSSCTSVKDLPYLRDIPDSTKEKMVKEAPYTDPLIQPDDIISVTIITIDPTTSVPVNQSSIMPVSASSTASPAAAGLVPGLLVDKEGNISEPILGTIHVGGLSTSQAKTAIKAEADKYFKQTDVQVRFANFSVTVIGEVVHPSTFVIPNEKISILDALGMAGDLTVFGRRENVMVIRNVDGKKEVSRLNLNNSDIFKSPCFYLRQNDVVYVEPNRSKAIQADAEQTRVITIAASILTGLFLYLRLAK